MRYFILLLAIIPISCTKSTPQTKENQYMNLIVLEKSEQGHAGIILTSEYTSFDGQLKIVVKTGLPDARTGLPGPL